MFFLDCLFHIFPFFILLVFISSHCNFCIAFSKFSLLVPSFLCTAVIFLSFCFSTCFYSYPRPLPTFYFPSSFSPSVYDRRLGGTLAFDPALYLSERELRPPYRFTEPTYLFGRRAVGVGRRKARLGRRCCCSVMLFYMVMLMGMLRGGIGWLSCVVCHYFLIVIVYLSIILLLSDYRICCQMLIITISWLLS